MQICDISNDISNDSQQCFSQVSLLASAVIPLFERCKSCRKMISVPKTYSLASIFFFFLISPVKIGWIIGYSPRERLCHGEKIWLILSFCGIFTGKMSRVFIKFCSLFYVTMGFQL